MKIKHILLLIVLSFTSTIFAQDGMYDVRFKINEVDCSNMALYVDIEVRADAPGTEFRITDQNYRFSFNRNALANPQIDRELVLSGLVTTTVPETTNSFFSPHTYTGSLDTVVSYNVELSGDDGYPLTDVEYIPVGRIKFDILDLNSCVDLKWHTKAPLDFPPTFIGEKTPVGIIFSVDEGAYGNYKQCLNIACSNLPPIATMDSGTTPKNVSISIDLSSNDTDPEDNLDISSISLNELPPVSQGNVVLDTSTGVLTFTPTLGFAGTVTPFTYQICDAGTFIPSTHGDENPDPVPQPDPMDPPILNTASLCQEATVNIYVEYINYPPTAVDDAVVTQQDTPIVIDATANDSDIEDGSPLEPCTVTIVTPPANGTASIGILPLCNMNYVPNPTFSGIDTYAYEVCDSEGLCDQAIVTTTVSPCPETDLSINPSSLCVDEIGVFLAENAGAGAVYTWNFGTIATPNTAFGQGPHNVSFNTAGTQQIELTVLNFGCQRTKTFTVDVNDIPVAALAAYPDVLCVGEPGLFDGETGAAPGAVYTWDFGADATPATATGIGGHTVSYTSAGVKTTTLTVTNNGCFSTVQQNVNVFQGPLADAGLDQTICSTGAATLAGACVSGATYVWSPGTGLSNQFACNPVASPTQTTTYTVYTIYGGCTTTDQITITVDDTSVPFVEAGEDQVICEGDDILIGGTPTTNAPGPDVIIEWTTTGDITTISDPSIMNPTVNPLATAVYTVCVTNEGCTKCDNVIVTLNPSPAIDGGPNVTTCPGVPVVIGGNPTAASDAVIQWTPATGLSNPNAQNPLASPTITTEYVVSVTRNDCTDTDTILVTVDYYCSPPVAVDDFYETDQNTSITIPNNNAQEVGILDNDFDPDATEIYILGANPTITIISTVDPSNSIIIDSLGGFTYTPGPDFSGTDSFEYEICDDDIPASCDQAIIFISIRPLIDVQLSVFLEGAYRPLIDMQLSVFLEGAYDETKCKMKTRLNLKAGNALHRGILPGQNPYFPFATPTPAVQPYNIAPWNYAGMEATFSFGPWYTPPTAGDFAVYHPDVVDWVYVRFRDAGTLKTVKKAAALVLKDGSVIFSDFFQLKSYELSSPFLYVQIDHRNHMAVMTPAAIDVSDGFLLWDFRVQDSYRTPTTYGQKEVPFNSGVWAMFAGDGLQKDDVLKYEINAGDKILWSGQSGHFDQYLKGDFNMDADVNGQDKDLWAKNNGIHSAVPKQDEP